jgi:hypothetical protein
MMAQRSSGKSTGRDVKPATAGSSWRLPQGAAPPAPPGPRAKWLLIAAIVLQMGWLAALAAMAIFVKWRS